MSNGPVRILLDSCGLAAIGTLIFISGTYLGATWEEGMANRRVYTEVRQIQGAAVAAGVGWFDRDSQWSGRGDFHFGIKPATAATEKP